MATAFLGLGSNMGNRLANLQEAVDRLDAEPDIAVVRSSRVYESDPVGGPPQPDFLNAVIEVETTLPPRELLDACRAVEEALHRVRTVRWGPRSIDVDILAYDRRTVDEPDLQIPHPRMHERAFVLLPLLELDPDPQLPAGATVASLRLGPDALSGARPHAPPLVVGRP